MTLATPPIPTPSKRLFTTEQYYLMAKSGILDPSERVELIQGEIIAMSPIGSLHAWTVTFLILWVSRIPQSSARFGTQSSIILDDHNVPEPDLWLAKPRADGYRHATPHAQDLLLVIEVSDSSLPYDMQIKRPLYAAAGIPEFWIVDLNTNTLHIFRAPADGQYRETVTLAKTDRVWALAFADHWLELGALFPD